jgi:4-aminobutyrate aminotransferase-like enzyme
VQRVVHHCLDHGVLGFWFLSCPTAFRIAPPLTIDRPEVEMACLTILDAVERTD